MIEIKNVKISYAEQVVLEDLNFTVHSGELFGVLGRNGVGKSTLLKALVGLKDLVSGNILLNGNDIGYLPEVAEAYDYMTGIELLKIVSNIKGCSESESYKLIDDISNYILIPELDKLISSYSKGNLEKLLFILLFISYPKVIVLDEPFTGFDTESIIGAKQYLKEYAEKGNIVIFSTHIIEMCAQLCDRVIIIIDKDKLINLDLNNVNKLEEKICIIESHFNKR